MPATTARKGSAAYEAGIREGRAMSAKARTLEPDPEESEEPENEEEEMDMDALGDLLEAQGMSTNVKKFICSNCPRTFPTKKGLDTHERINSKKILQCEHCEFLAKTKK